MRSLILEREKGRVGEVDVRNIDCLLYPPRLGIKPSA